MVTINSQFRGQFEHNIIHKHITTMLIYLF